MTTETATHFGNWLRRQIEDREFSIAAFARHAGIPLRSVQRWLAEPCPGIRGHFRTRLARSLGVERDVIDGQLDAASAAA